MSVPKEEMHSLDEESDVDPVPLTDEERAKVQRGERQITDGEFVTLEVPEAKNPFTRKAEPR